MRSEPLVMIAIWVGNTYNVRAELGAHRAPASVEDPIGATHRASAQTARGRARRSIAFRERASWPSPSLDGVSRSLLPSGTTLEPPHASTDDAQTSALSSLSDVSIPNWGENSTAYLQTEISGGVSRTVVRKSGSLARILCPR